MITENYKGRSLELYEVIQKVQSTDKRADKVRLLQEHNTQAFLDYYRCLFDDRVQFLLPDGKPPYTPNVEESVPSTWRKEHIKLKYFVKGLRGDELLPLKRETIYIGVLEAVHPEDALLLVDMINKKPPKGITKKLISESFPQLNLA